MKFSKVILAGALLSLPLFSHTAQAADYCREYQKAIHVGGHIEEGYGTACMQPDGSWMIVDSRGTVDPFDDLRRQNVVLVSQQQPVYYAYGPSYRPVSYYPRAYYGRPYYSRPYNSTSLIFSFGNNNDHDRWNNNRRWDNRNDRWDHNDRNDHDRGRGRH